MNLVVMAALLHETGQFALAAKACPGGDSAAATKDFICNMLPPPRGLESEMEKLAELAVADPATRDGALIRKAEDLAVGLDRKENYAPACRDRLPSIFSRVRLAGKGLAEQNLVYPLLPLGEGRAIFPAAEAPGDYKSLWEQFCRAVKALPRDQGLRAWQSSLLSTLERYCWCVPSAKGHQLPDISLYDHSAVTAAIAQVLSADNSGRFLLFGGDLSGIQAFIFGREEPADRGAVRLLRARSFLLQAATRSIWLTLLARLNLEPVAKIMDAGGRFVLLLPDNKDVAAQTERLQEEAELWLLDRFQGAVRLNFASVSLTEKDLQIKEFAARFESFNEALENAKLHPFAKACQAGKLPVLEVGYADYGEFGECAFCHTRPGVAKKDEKSICNLCAELMRLGQKLPQTGFIAFTRGQTSAGERFANLLFDDLALVFYDKMPPATEAAQALDILSVRGELIYTVAPIAGHMPEISKADIERWEAEGRLTARDGKELFMGEDCRPGIPKTFGMLAQEARIAPRKSGEPWRCMPCLAVCKADVDNLGMIFSMGFGDNFSLSCYAMLARMLNHFFSGWLMQQIRDKYPDIYVVFAGGDDVFVLGPWRQVIEFGQMMAKEFGAFCGKNPAVSISAGMPLVKAGLPMRAIREEAEGCLETSKHYSNENDSKNALTLFGVTAHWDAAEALLADGRWLAELCEQGTITRGFLRRMLGYARQCNDFIHGKKLAQNGLYMSHLQYDLARNWQSMTGKGAEAKDNDAELIKLKELVNDKDKFSKSEMGISWAIYRTRIGDSRG